MYTLANTYPKTNFPWDYSRLVHFCTNTRTHRRQVYRVTSNESIRTCFPPCIRFLRDADSETNTTKEKLILLAKKKCPQVSIAKVIASKFHGNRLLFSMMQKKTPIRSSTCYNCNLSDKKAVHMYCIYNKCIFFFTFENCTAHRRRIRMMIF